MSDRSAMKEARRVVVKVGTSTITGSGGSPNLERIRELASELSALQAADREMILVTSGAIATGVAHMGLKGKPGAIPDRQALAAVGQVILMHIYETFFTEFGVTIGQLLLTKENSVRHHQYINSRNAIQTMISMGVIPIVNENDAVSLDELKIGDNDTLSATVATLADADALVILSDIDGLYTSNPAKNHGACLIDEVREITPEIESLADGTGSALATGGMATKLSAARIAMNAGVTMVIAPGERSGVIKEVLSGAEVGTIFPAKEAHLKVRKSWLAFGRHIEGSLHIDAGAARALIKSGSSLLAAGIISSDGDFKEKSTVRVLDPSEREIARGIVNFSSDIISGIAGKKTADIRRIIPGARDEVIHRDNMVIMV